VIDRGHGVNLWTKSQASGSSKRDFLPPDERDAAYIGQGRVRLSECTLTTVSVAGSKVWAAYGAFRVIPLHPDAAGLKRSSG
jgi:hypothetical protein